MNYMQELEKDLRTRLEQGSALELEEWEGWTTELITFVKDAVLKSFKNGLEAAKNRAKRKTGQPPKNLPAGSSRKAE
jgi:hypothetical protein